MRKWLLRLHLYGGLLCAPYLIIFGFSSLHYNHREHGPHTFAKTAEWEEPLTVELKGDAQAAGVAVRNSLGMAGYLPTGKARRDGAGNLQFDVERPGKGYTVRVDVAEKKVRVEERHKGTLHVVDALHGFRGVSNSKFSETWGWYTELCTLFTVFAAVSGIYLWVNSQRERKAGLMSMFAALALSVGMMLYVIFKG